MSILVLLLHLAACAVLILVVLLQTGKGASLGAAFGGASQTMFGGAGATSFLAKLTTVMAILFMITSLGLTMVDNSRSPESVMQGAPVATTQQAPATSTDQQAPAADQGKTQEQSQPASGQSQ